MSYCLNLGDWGSIFAVPTAVVDKHIKLVGSIQLKVLLWILSKAGQSFSEDDVAKSLSVHREDVKDSVNYWIETGILKRVNDVISPGNNEFCVKNENISDKSDDKLKNNKSFDGNKVNIEVNRIRPDNSYITERIESSKEIAFLMQEAQVILGRPISPRDSAVLLMLLDNEGLPIDVILMIIQYAVSIGKGNMRYIEAVGISWAKEDIDTIEKAENKIKSLSDSIKAWKKFEEIIGIKRQPTSREKEAVNRWYNEWGYKNEEIKEAYETCINFNDKYILKYIDSIISRWHREGIKTLRQILDERSRHKGNFKNKKEEKASYNISEYEKYNIMDEINLGMNDDD